MHTSSASDGVELSFRSFGEGPNTVILIHGWMVSGAVYDDLIPLLAAPNLRIIVPDLRGSGRSARPESGYTLTQHASDVAAVAEAAGARSYVVVGNSMGGQIAQILAATRRDRVRGAVLLCSVPAAGMNLPDEARGLFRGSANNRGAQETILNLATKELSAAARDKMLSDAGNVSVAAIEHGFDAWTAGGFADTLGAIEAPTLVVATDDPFLPPDFLQKAIADLIPRAGLAYLPGPGHYPQVERPRETAALIKAFLAALRP